MYRGRSKTAGEKELMSKLTVHRARESIAEGYSGESLGRWRQAMNGLDTDPGRKAQRSTGLD